MSTKEIVGRFLQMLVALLGVSILTFALTFIAPGDPVDAILNTSENMVSKEYIEEVRHDLGLDQPFYVQYLRWLGGVLTGDMGESFSAQMPVVDKLMQNMKGTVILAGMSTLMTVVVGVPLGIVAALYRNKAIDYLLRFCTFVGVSVPGFWVGLILLYVFGLKLGFFPITGGEVTFDRLILPATTLAVVQTSKFLRQTRTAVLEELGQDYIIGLRARGIPMQKILWKHVLRNACLPLITMLGLSIGWALGGVAVVEMVFGWPGIGRMAVDAIRTRDYPLVQGFVLWVAALYMLINLIVDMSYYYLDPRLKRGGR